jgi:hypothetical protein
MSAMTQTCMVLTVYMLSRVRVRVILFLYSVFPLFLIFIFIQKRLFFFIPYGAFARLETLGTVTGEVRKEAKT